MIIKIIYTQLIILNMFTDYTDFKPLNTSAQRKEIHKDPVTNFRTKF